MSFVNMAPSDKYGGAVYLSTSSVMAWVILTTLGFGLLAMDPRASIAVVFTIASFLSAVLFYTRPDFRLAFRYFRRKRSSLALSRRLAGFDLVVRTYFVDATLEPSQYVDALNGVMANEPN